MKTKIQNRERKNIEIAKKLAKDTGLSPMIAEFLCDKGYKTKEEIDNFINFDEKNLRKISQMKDGLIFLNRLKNAILNKEKIVIFGDYDGDGISATAIFIWTIRWLQENSDAPSVEWFIPDRFKEGYGLSVKSMQRLIATYPDVDLVVTCDNGIVAFDGVDYARQHGIDIIISDHHEASPDGKLPDCPVLCEKRLDEDKTKIESFCGAELARRICVNLVYMLKRDDIKPKLELLYAFSGFATITDVIEMNASNHYVAKRGLEAINSGRIPCFNALKKVQDVKRDVDEDTIGFRYGPMINAAGRILGEATIPELLFIEQDEEKAKSLALKLNDLNTIRQEMSLTEQKNVVKEIEENNYQNNSFIIVDKYDYKEGIAGLNASYIVDNYKVPAICFCQKEDDSTMLKGSGRSVEGFNLKAALDNCKDLLVGYGGHPMAAGITIKKENLGKFRERMNYLAKNITDIEVCYNIDYLIEPNEVSVEMVNEYKKYLAPFGPAFEKPVYAVKGIFKPRPLIMKEKHLRFSLVNHEQLSMVWFNSLLKYKTLNPESKKIIAIGQPNENIYNGTTNVQFLVDELFVF